MAKWLKIEPSDIANSIRIFFSFRNTPYKLDFDHQFKFYEYFKKISKLIFLSKNLFFIKIKPMIKI